MLETSVKEVTKVTDVTEVRDLMFATSIAVTFTPAILVIRIVVGMIDVWICDDFLRYQWLTVRWEVKMLVGVLPVEVVRLLC